MDPAVIAEYEREIIPFWRGRSLRDQMFGELPQEWLDAYAAGLLHRVHGAARAGPHRRRRQDLPQGHARLQSATSRRREAALDFERDPEALDKREQLRAMSIACDAVIRFAERHAELAEIEAAKAQDDARRQELLKIADVCRWVPAHAPRDFHEALQYYWFCHLAVITELNGWDAFSPGHLDQHLWPFYEAGLADGTLTRESARELLECFFIKFNNHTAPPKVGVTAAESGTYTDFANINLAGLLRDGRDGSNEVTHLLLDIIDEMHLLQPSSNMQVSRKTPDAVLKHALRVIRNGYGFPSLFNADAVVEEQLRQGKTLEDAREGGCSGCVEVGAFGKEAYILTGYFNLMKMLELALHDGFDVRTGQVHRRAHGRPGRVRDLRRPLRRVRGAGPPRPRHQDPRQPAHRAALRHAHAAHVPVGHHRRLHREGQGLQRRRRALQQHLHPGRRHRQHHRQPVGAEGTGVRAAATCRCPGFVEMLDADFNGQEPLRQRLLNKTHKYGNDDDYADDADDADVPHALRGDRRAAEHARAAPTASRCCPPPATSTSARSAWRRPTAAARASRSRRASAPCRAPIATGRRPS